MPGANIEASVSWWTPSSIWGQNSAASEFTSGEKQDIVALLQSLYLNSNTAQNVIDEIVANQGTIRLENTSAGSFSVVSGTFYTAINMNEDDVAINRNGDVVSEPLTQALIHELAHQANPDARDPNDAITDQNQPDFDFKGTVVDIENTVDDELGIPEYGRSAYLAEWSREFASDNFNLHEGQNFTGGQAIDDTRFGDIDDNLLDMRGRTDASKDLIWGFLGNDHIYSGDGNDYVYGDLVDNSIVNSGGDDYIDGGNGDDHLFGGKGKDTIFGGVGNDTIFGDEGSKVIDAGDGDDDVVVKAPDGKNINGDDAVTEIKTGAGNDTIWIEKHLTPETALAPEYLITDGDPGDHIFWNGYGLTGGIPMVITDTTDTEIIRGFQEIVGKLGEVYYLGGGFLDIELPDHQIISIQDFSNGDFGINVPDLPPRQDNHLFQKDVYRSQTVRTDYDDFTAAGWYQHLSDLEGRAQALATTGPSVAPTEQGGSGSVGQDTPTTISGGNGDDVLNGTVGNDLVTGLAGNDILNLSPGDDTYTWNIGDGSDVISGVGPWAGTNELVFGAGLLASNASFSVTSDGNGLQIAFGGIAGSVTADAILSPSSNDQISSFKFGDGTVWSKADLLSAAAPVIDDWRSVIRGDDSDNSLVGTVGNDKFLGGKGDDVIDGGAGDDTAFFSGNSAGYSTYLRADGSADVSDNVGTDGTDTLTSIEHLSFTGDSVVVAVQPVAAISGGGVSMTGTMLADTLDGSPSNDLIFGLAGNDTIVGESGDDTLNGGTGNNHIDGGAGTNTVSYADASALVTIDLTAGTGNSADRHDTLVSIQNITGSSFNDTLTGDTNSNIIHGGSGADVINAGAGVDTVYGEPGNDTINGNGGADIIYGNGGADRLLGGSGADTLIGGDGADTFAYTLLTDSTSAAPDLITDFVSGQDKIDLTALHTNASDTFTIASSGGFTTISVDQLGNGSVDQLIKLTGTNVVVSSDILWTPPPGGSAVTTHALVTVPHDHIGTSLHAVALDHGLYA